MHRQTGKEWSMGVSRQYWNEAYRDGVFSSHWDYDFPSQELIGALSVLEFTSGRAALDLVTDRACFHHKSDHRHLLREDLLQRTQD
mgnify:CR=1 FL=1